MEYLTDEEIEIVRNFVGQRQEGDALTLSGIGKVDDVDHPTNFGERMRRTCENQHERIPFLQVYGYTRDPVTGARKPEADRQHHIYYRFINR